VVSQHPAVHQCSVVGCADKDHVRGPPVLLSIWCLTLPVPAAKRKQIIKELRQLCIEELPEYVQPVGYKIIWCRHESFPMCIILLNNRGE